VRPDGQYAYAVNLRSNDVNVVDLRTGSISKKIPGAGGLLMLSGNILAVLSPSRIHLIDTSSNRKISELVIDGPRNLVWTPEEEYAVVLCPKTLSCIETRTGREISRFEDFKAASDFVIARRPEGNQ
jgi:YVTN family beta-propeller protein